jgi:histidine ammonia-lyase
MKKVEVSPEALAAMEASHKMVRDTAEGKDPVYGVNTGFGQLAGVKISAEHSSDLQRNLIMSHACGVGEPFPAEIVRGIMLLRANALSNGFSGVNPKVVEILIAMLNEGVHPVVPMKGSLGASGDLCHLAHVALVMIGMGEAVYNGRLMPGAEAMAAAGIDVLDPRDKDGLGLINGTQAMGAIGTFCVYDAMNLMELANACAALTVEALGGRDDAFDEKLHKARPHQGQIVCAAEMRRLLEGSKNVNTAGRVQDAYSLRCVPQVHGASWDAINYAKNVLTVEINAVTDNPLVFPKDGQIISGGNFHGQPLALCLDFLAIALAELANISERRTERLVNPQLSGLPGFLTHNPGLNSGFMIAQYTAASLVSENKVLAHPASVDSIPSSANQEDHVSMGAVSARKCAEIVNNVKYTLAIELLAAAQALDISGRTEGLGERAAALHKAVRSAVPVLESDRVLSTDIELIKTLIDSGALTV